MNNKKTHKNYENFRWFFTSNGNLVVGGKSDEQNEIVLKNFLKPNYIVLHTSKPGSPFMIIQANNPDKKNIDEAAIFCGCFSQQWKLNKGLIDIDIFMGEQIYKSKLMKKGTFGVKGDVKKIKIKPELVLVMQKGKIRGVPKTTREEILVEIKQGNMNKEEAADKIAKKIKSNYALAISRDEIMQAIPSDNIDVK
ncbi:DUF814 domain-containing protein [Candidatus Pacearchaeota archaeon]|nr:DUF814 domain-containing protein [Candidatus Pacearchaeota archaeon]